MFHNTYNKSPLVGAAADEIFPRIKGDAYNGDVSLATAMRVLLYDRLPEGKEARGIVRNAEFSSLIGVDVGTPDFMKKLVGDDYQSDAEDRLYIINLNCGNDTDAAFKVFNGVKTLDGMDCCELIEKNVFGVKDDGGHPVMKAKFYENIGLGKAIVICFDSLNSGKIHAIASLTSRYFKRYFADKPITAWEKENIATALAKDKSPDKFVAAVESFAERFDFRTPAINALLTGFENVNYKKRVEVAADRVSRAQRDIDNWNDRYARLVRELRDAEDTHRVVLLGAREGDGNGIRDLFLADRNLHLEGVENGTMTFWAKTQLGNFDRDMMEQLIANPDRDGRSVLYYGGPNRIKKADRDLLYKALFVDETVRLWLCGQFLLDNGDNIKVEAVSGFTPCPEMHDTMPNPHLQRHACMGDNRRYANEALAMGDYVNAVIQTVGSVASINLNEGATTDPWMKYIFEDKWGKCWELADGRRVKFSDLMKILKEGK